MYKTLYILPILFVLVGCGEKIVTQGEEITPVVNEDVKDPNNIEWITHTVDNVSFDLPSTWKYIEIDDPDVEGLYLCFVDTVRVPQAISRKIPLKWGETGAGLRKTNENEEYRGLVCDGMLGESEHSIIDPVSSGEYPLAYSDEDKKIYYADLELGNLYSAKIVFTERTYFMESLSGWSDLKTRKLLDQILYSVK